MQSQRMGSGEGGRVGLALKDTSLGQALFGLLRGRSELSMMGEGLAVARAALTEVDMLKARDKAP